MHTPSPLGSQVTIVAVATRHWYGTADVSQTSVPLQKLPSSKPAQSAVLVHWQVLVPEAHTPPLHASPTVHALPSSQVAVLLTCVQPVATLHASFVHALPSLQDTVGSIAVPLQAPAAHASLLVHALPSSQASVFGAYRQPVAGLQLSVVHKLPSLQTSAVPRQEPPLHVSPWLHALPTLQAEVLLVNTQAPVAKLQLSVVQELLSLHTVAAPAAQAPLAHASPTVHGLPSLHGELFGTWLHPVLAPQASLVHGLPSSQFRFAPALHTPPMHASPTVHTLPSASQDLPSLMAAIAHLPVVVVHWFCAHVVLAVVSHVTIVDGFTLHW